MFKDVVVFFQKELNDYINWRYKEQGKELGALENPVQFVKDICTSSAIELTPNKITPLLINVEEEASIRPANRYQTVNEEGKYEEAMPPIRLNLYMLFVAYYTGDYTNALEMISLVVEFFQGQRLFERENYQGKKNEMPEDADNLRVELVTLPLAQQNELWNSLRSASWPHAYYKVSVVTLEDKTREYKTLEVSKDVEYRSRYKYDYTEMFSFRIFHTYYRNNRCLDFNIVPIEHTPELLKKLQIKVERLPNGIKLNSPEKLRLDEIGDHKLLFKMVLRNDTFEDFTDLEDLMPSGEQVRYWNNENESFILRENGADLQGNHPKAFGFLEFTFAGYLLNKSEGKFDHEMGDVTTANYAIAFKASDPK